MASKGIEGLYVETHNWGKAVAFWKALGFELIFETSHHSGELRHPEGGPYVFLAERPAGKELELTPVIAVESQSRFKPPRTGKVIRKFKREHWGKEMRLSDPDHRIFRVLAKQKKKKKAGRSK